MDPIIPSRFDLKRLPASQRATDIVVEARRSPERLPLPRDDASASDFCRNEHIVERMQTELLRAGRGLRGCMADTHDKGDVTLEGTRVRTGPRRRAQAVGIRIHD